MRIYLCTQTCSNVRFQRAWVRKGMMHGLCTDFTSSTISISLSNGGISHSNPGKAFSFDFISQYFSKLHSSCAFKHLWVGNLQDHLSKNTLQNGFVLECRKSPTFNLKQLQAEDIFSSYSLSIAGELFHIPANTHSFLILIRLLLVEIRYSRIKSVQDNSKMEYLLKLFH